MNLEVLVAVLILASITWIFYLLMPENTPAKKCIECDGNFPLSLLDDNNTCKTCSKEECITTKGESIITQKQAEVTKSITNIVERAQIANKAIEDYPMDELKEVLKLLKDKKEVIEAIDIFNEQIRDSYLNLLNSKINKYKTQDIALSENQIAFDLSQCMKLGKESVLEVVASEFQGINMESGSTITKTHSWDQLKDHF